MPAAKRLIPLVILLVAAFFRLHQLPDLPPGLNFDEAGNGVAVLDILAGSPQLWWSIGGGKEPLWPYLVALSTAVLGHTPLALRLPAAFAGILTVAAVYPLLMTLFRHRLLAWLTMAGLAVSGWHLHFSRLGFRAILLPLLSTLAIYFFWKAMLAWRRENGVGGKEYGVGSREYGVGSKGYGVGSRGSIAYCVVRKLERYALRITQYVTTRFLILASLATALSIYAYLAARLLPFVIVIFCGLLWLLNRRNFRSLFLLAVTYLLFTALFLLPLIIHFSFNPAEFVARSAAVSIFNSAWHQGDLLGAAWQTLTLTLSTFLGLHGDPNPLVNLPTQPAIPLFLAPFFVTGLGVGIYHTLRLAAGSIPPQTHQTHQTHKTLLLPRSPAPPLPYPPAPLLLTWWLTMLLPALLAPEGAPHHLRLIGALVPTYALLALGLLTTTNLLTNLLRPRHAATSATPYALRPTPYILPAILYLSLTFHTYTTYFTRWPQIDFTLPFDLYATRLAAHIALAPASTAYVLPMDIRAAAEARHYTIDYLLAPERTADYTYIPVDERNAERLLTQAAAGHTELRVVRWTADKHLEADAKEIVTYLLETQAQPLARESFPVYDIETYALPDEAGHQFRLPPINQPVGAVFDNRLRLDAVYLPETVRPGERLPVALTLAPVGPMEVDYKASLRLTGPDGERLDQKDRQLMHNFHQGTSLWPPETVNEYYLLAVPPETPPGEYTVSVVIYHPDTLAPLVAGGMAEVPLGTVTVESP